MFRLTVIVAFLACAYGSSLPPVLLLDGRIVGGVPANIDDAPYQVALLKGSDSGGYNQACGGSIITRLVIVTAAHCTDGTTPSEWRVRAGSSFHNDGGQVVQVIRIVQHNNFNYRYDYDISLVKVETGLNFGPGVAPIILPSQGANVKDGSLALVTGWGHLSEGGVQPTQLYKVAIPIVNQVTCVNAYSEFNPVTGNMICAGRYKIGGQDACQGDSGGPLVINRVLIGITSWGRGCAQANYPGVWTRVSNFRTWINANVKIIHNNLQ